MAIYMTQFTYTTEAWRAMIQNPQDRSAAVSELMQKSGGRLINFYYSFGDYEGLAIVETPDDFTNLVAKLTTLARGHLKDVKTTRLFTVEETMEAMKKAGSMAFSSPSNQ